MRMRRAHEQHGECIGRRGIVGITPATGQEALVLAARDRMTELEWRVHRVPPIRTGVRCRRAQVVVVFATKYSQSFDDDLYTLVPAPGIDDEI